MATEPELDSKAGENVDLTGWTEANKNLWVAQAESVVNVTARENFSDSYAGLNNDLKRIMSDIVSNLCAIYGIQYNMGGFNSRVEAEDMINILRDAALRGLALIRDKKAVDFINGT